MPVEIAIRENKSQISMMNPSIIVRRSSDGGHTGRYVVIASPTAV